MKKGWDLKRSKDGSTHHFFVSKHDRVPLIWKNNALACGFYTKILSINYMVNLGDELGEISAENGWRATVDYERWCTNFCGEGRLWIPRSKSPVLRGRVPLQEHVGEACGWTNVSPMRT